jgi:hypothetical protein
VAECVRFARRAGYRTLRLWTNNVLEPARHLYEKTGFRLIEEEPHHSFGHSLIGETWELQLSDSSRHPTVRANAGSVAHSYPFPTPGSDRVFR